MQRSLEYYFDKPSSSAGAVPSENSEGTNTKPVVLTIGPRKRPVGRPRKPSTKPATRQLVDYSSTDSEESTNESPPLKKSRIHRMYSQGQKRMVAYYARQHGIRKAARHYGIHHRNVQRWVKNQVTLLKNKKKRSNKKGQGRKISYPQELEDKIMSWILEKREEKCVAVSTKLICLKALSLIKDTCPNFKASDGWVRKFMKRNDLVLRVRTHISQNLPKDLEEKIKYFRTEVEKIRENSDYPLEYICNMDETPVFLDLVPNKVVDRKGKKTVCVRTTGSEKNRITAALCCTAAGKLL